MIALDRGHLTATHQAAIELDEDLRAWSQELARFPTAGSVAELVQFLREHGDYWERVQTGRLQTVRRILARIGRPFFTPQIRYNLLLAEMVGRIEVSLAELRQEVQALHGPGANESPTRTRRR
jgi:hypothetical protein